MNCEDFIEKLSNDLEDLFKIYKARNEINSFNFEDDAKTANLKTLQEAINSYFNKMKEISEEKTIFFNHNILELSHFKIKSETMLEVVTFYKIMHIFSKNSFSTDVYENYWGTKCIKI